MTISPSFKSAAGGYQPRGWRKIARRRTAAGSIFDSPRKRSGHLHCARVRGRGDATRNSCFATYPMLTAKMASVQTELGSDFGSKIAFLSITIDPEQNTPDVLRRFARTFGADPAGWKFLTGSPAAIQDIERRYGAFASKSSDREMDHTNLTSLVDPRGMLRVQYLGVRFDSDEFRRDLLGLVEKPGLASNR
jgi:hypothetical protein